MGAGPSVVARLDPELFEKIDHHLDFGNEHLDGRDVARLHLDPELDLAPVLDDAPVIDMPEAALISRHLSTHAPDAAALKIT